jgi:hypothetical protein
MELNAQVFADMVDGGIYREDIKPIELAKYIAKKYCAFDDAELSLMDMYWDIAFNKSWLYVSPDMVENMFGYKNCKNMMSNFGSKLKNNFSDCSDYKIIGADHELVIKFYSRECGSKDARGGSSKIHYAITGETFKCLTLMSGTETGTQTRKYYLKIERLCMTTVSTMTECVILCKNKELAASRKALDEAAEINKKISDDAAEASKKAAEIIKAQDKQLSEANQKNVKLNEFVKVAQDLKKDEIFYIATSPLCAEKNRFKYGGVSGSKELNGRLAGYNTGHMVDDAFYFAKIYKCHKYRHIENCVEMLTKIFKDKSDSRKEILHIRFNCLVELVEFVIENDSKSIDYINEHGKRFLDETIDAVAIVPPPVSIDDLISTSSYAPPKKSKKQKDTRINVSTWDNTQLRDALRQVVIECARDKFGETFDIENSKEKINLTWSELANILEIKYVGQTRTSWKSELKNLANGLCVSIGWKAK